jgi:hypothetical protein
MRPACAGRKCASADMGLVVDATIGTDGPTGTFQETPNSAGKPDGASLPSGPLPSIASPARLSAPLG